MFRAIGFVILLIALLVLMPAVFHGLEATLLKFFAVMGDVLSLADRTIQSASTVQLSAPGIGP